MKLLASIHWRKFRKPLAIAAILLCAMLLFAFYFLFLHALPKVPSFAEVKEQYVKSEGILLDRHGEIIHELRISNKGRRLEWTKLQDISPALQKAVIESEDHRFYQHSGVDWRATAAAAIGNIRSSRERGASTITMQLAALQDKFLRPGSRRRSIFEKSQQMRTARTYEKFWTKDNILEAYLNLATFKGELQGIAAASRGIFSKEPQGLTATESSILAALLRSPNATIEEISTRAYALLKKERTEIDRADFLVSAKASLAKPVFVQPQIALAPHIALRLFQSRRQENDPRLTLLCTLDGRLQQFAAETLKKHVSTTRSQNMHDGAVLVVDNATGEVLAYVGNTGEGASARYVDGIQAMRQAGSTLKPFLYALAFERRILTPVSLIDDSPIDIAVPGGSYRPRNYDNQFNGIVTARVALASSLNVPAVKVLNLVGVEGLATMLRRLGFNEIREPDYYGPSLALGSADISLWSLTNAYMTIANKGLWHPLRITPDEPSSPPVRVISEEAAYLVSDILSDRESRSITFDLENPLSTRYWTAVKTGTSKDMRDNWCVGFSSKYTVGVWAGNFSGEPMWNVSGVTGAAPIWIEIMNWLHNGYPSQKPNPPSGVVRCNVEISSLNQTKPEWFIKGTESEMVRNAGQHVAPQISYPTDGTIVMIDPDIPVQNQLLFFEATPASSSLQWMLNDKKIGDADAIKTWAPIKGNYVLQLMDGDKKIDTVRFEVRGN